MIAMCVVPACGDDGGGTGTIDASTIDAPSSGPCTGAIYDPCTDNAQCMSGNCKLYMGSNFQVCTMTCTPGDNSSCPLQNGEPAICNNMGFCKPAAPNNCTR